MVVTSEALAEVEGDIVTLSACHCTHISLSAILCLFRHMLQRPISAWKKLSHCKTQRNMVGVTTTAPSC